MLDKVLECWTRLLQGRRPQLHILFQKITFLVPFFKSCSSSDVTFHAPLFSFHCDRVPGKVAGFSGCSSIYSRVAIPKIRQLLRGQAKEERIGGKRKQKSQRPNISPHERIQGNFKLQSTLLTRQLEWQAFGAWCNKSKTKKRSGSGQRPSGSINCITSVPGTHFTWTKQRTATEGSFVYGMPCLKPAAFPRFINVLVVPDCPCLSGSY